MADNIVVLSSNNFTTTTTSNSVPVVNTLPAPTETVVLNTVQMVSNPAGTTTQYWTLSGSNLYPNTTSYKLIVGTSSLVTDETLRILGKANVTSLSLGTDAYSIYTSGGELYFKDTLNTKKLSDFGGVSSVASGVGMNFTTITGTGTITMGTPSAITSTSTSAATGTTHSHAIDSTIINTGGSYTNPAWMVSLGETKVLPSQTGNSGYYLKTNGTTSSWSPISLSNDVFYFSGTSYTPYAASTAGKFDSSTTNPSATNRLNYNGYLYATQFIGQHVVGGTSGDLCYTNSSYVTTGIGNWNGTTLTISGNVQANVVYVEDADSYIANDGSGNMTFTDVISGTKTLTEIVSGATNFWTSTTSGIYNVGNVAIGGTTFTSGAELTVTGEIAATNFDSSKYRWRNSNICIGTNAGDNELNNDRFYCDITNTSNPMLYGDFNSRYWVFNGDTYWGVGKKQYFSSTTNSIYADGSNNLTFKDGVAASGVAIPLVNLINGTYNALKSDFTAYSTVTAITAANVANWNTAYTKSSVISITGAGTHFLGEDGLYRPISATISLGDDILKYDTVNGWYEPYTTKTAGAFYNTDTTAPSSTNQLLYDGYFYATRLYVDDILSDVINTSGGTRTAGYFYTGTTDPVSGNRLNYDGYLRVGGIWATAGSFTALSTGVSTATLSASQLSILRDAADSAAALYFTTNSEKVTEFIPDVSDGASALPYYFDTYNALSTTGAKLMSVLNNGVEKLYIDYAGNINSLVFKTSGATTTTGYFDNSTNAPTNATNRINYSGTLWASSFSTLGGAGTYGVYASNANYPIQSVVTGVGGTSLFTCSVDANPLSASQPNFTSSGTLTRDVCYLSRSIAGTGNLTGNIIYISDNPTTSGTIGGSVFKADVVTTTRINMNPRVADGAAAVSYFFDTTTNLSTDGAKLLSFRNAGVEKASIDKDGRVLCDKIWHVYGGFEDEAETITLTTDVWATITNATNDLWTSAEYDGFSLASDVMTITNAGDYVGSVSITMSGINSSANDYEVRLFNTATSTQVGFKQGITLTGANNYGNIVLPLYIENTAGHTYVIQVRNITDADDVVVEHGQFFLQYLHS